MLEQRQLKSGEISTAAQWKLDQSRTLAETLILREIKCPNCGFHLLDVYGHEHVVTRVKCRKCKFNEPIDTALFRTIRTRLPGYRMKPR